MNTSKLADLMFQKISNVSYDLATGATAIKTESGLISLNQQDHTLAQNPFDSLAMEIPAFAMLTPVKDLAEGDLIVTNGKAHGFITLATEGEELEVLSIDGHLTTFRPRTIQFLGQAAGVQVVKSLLNFGSTGEDKGLFSNPMMLMMLMGDNKDMSKMLPFMLMDGKQNMNPLMLMALMGDKGPFVR